MDASLGRTDDEIIKLFFNLESREDVANILEVDMKTLIYWVYRIDDNNKYTKFTIDKRDGSKRVIKAPIGPLKIIQSKLNEILQLVYMQKGHFNAHGFIDGRSIITNARPHVGKKYVFNLDLKDFFPSINFGRVRGMFIKTLQIGNEAATTLAQISCANNYLPQGSPCSPIISNFICKRMDKQLSKLARENNCTYTRYADDITFSSDEIPINRKIAFEDNSGKIHVGNNLRKIIESNGFEINEKKVHLSNQFEHQEVTGLVVNEKMNVRHSYIKNLRSMLYKSLKDGPYDAAIEYMEKFAINVPSSIFVAKDDPDKKETIEKWFINIIRGKLLYLKMIRGEEDLIFLKYASMFNELWQDDIFDIDELFNHNVWVQKRVVVIDNIGPNDEQGTGFFLKDYGIITCKHVIDKIDFSCRIHNPYTCKTFTMLEESIISDYELDVAISNHNSMEYYFEIETNPNYNIGQNVKLIGYPQYMKGNDIDIRECKIVSSGNYFGEKLYIVDGDIFHGASGGPVLNNNNKVIGIIRAGIESMDEEDPRTDMKRGFIPIDALYKLEGR